MQPNSDLRARAPALGAATADRLVRAYGTEAAGIVGDGAPAQLGADLGHGLTEAEMQWLMGREWAMTPEDVLWRRTKLGLRFSPEQTEALGVWMAKAFDGAALPSA